VAGVGDTLGLSIGNCFLPLPPVTVAGVSVVLGGVAGVSATLVHMVSVVFTTTVAGGVSAEGVAGVLVVSVSGVLVRTRYGYRVPSTQGEGVAGVLGVVSAEGVAGVSVVLVVFTTQCEGVAGVGDTRCRCFLLGALNSLKLLTTHSV